MDRKRTAGHKRWAWALGILGGITVILAVAAVFLFYVNQFFVVITLEGDLEPRMEYGEIYRDPGARAQLRGTRILQEGIDLPNVPVKITLPTGHTLGRQQITYWASFGPWQAQTTRPVWILDTQCPIIQLHEDEMEPQPGARYHEPTVTATDNFDGDITSRIRRSQEGSKIIYSVGDSSGNPASVEWEIPNFDAFPPEIFLQGGKHYSIAAGTPYVDPGFQALDVGEGDLTAQTQVEGSVIWWQPGVYPVTYTVRDSFDHETSLTREVRVVAQPLPETQWPQERTIYLTFDDGPGPYTMELLNVLDRYGVKATFFVTNSGYDQVMQEIASRGHSIGVHTVSHSYSQIYSSVEAYFQDLLQMRQIIFEETGIQTNLIRFPGGSSNEISRHYCQGIMTTLSQAVEDAGYQYFDWNVDSNDAGGAKTAEEVYQNVIEGVSRQRVSVVLQHDIHGFSVDAVEKIIRWGRNNGYQFRSLDVSSPAFHHGIRN